ncbi:hypothetical protein [Arthrobacter agilis]|uniref:hypothetical protein n=1 Tax=Arthrobacter agilis TaxID=37921 RepID=UPI00277F6B21|nr:hypothetical protein [Arthrobacter agilis]MDQ0735367.1 hypothetical protein [Arthrobacter agilis]
MKKLMVSSAAALGISILILLSGIPAAGALEIPPRQEPTISATVFEAGTTITFGGINAYPNTEVWIDFDEPRKLAFIDEERYTNPDLPPQQTIISDANGVFSTHVTFPVPGTYLIRGYWVDGGSGRVLKVDQTVEVTASTTQLPAIGTSTPQVSQVPIGGVDTGVPTTDEQPTNLGIVALGGGIVLAAAGISLRIRHLQAGARS